MRQVEEVLRSLDYIESTLLVFKPVLLVIEDSPTATEMVQEILNGKYTVIAVNTLEKGMELADKKRVNLILLDLNLPDSNGLDTVKQVEMQHPEIPVIVWTGETQITEYEALALGAEEFIQKGLVDGEEFQQTIERAWARHRGITKKGKS